MADRRRYLESGLDLGLATGSAVDSNVTSFSDRSSGQLGRV
jgi:hypothetical protein